MTPLPGVGVVRFGLQASKFGEDRNAADPSWGLGFQRL